VSEKGISPFISHSVVVLFSAFLILVVITTMNKVTDEYRTYFSDSEIDQFCFTIRSGIEKIYSEHTYNSQTNTTYGEITIDLPEKITDMGYRARFVGKNITITALNTQKNATCVTGFDVNLSGFTTGGLTKLEYKSNTDGTRIIIMSQV
jgi:hypothetical protein